MRRRRRPVTAPDFPPYPRPTPVSHAVYTPAPVRAFRLRVVNTSRMRGDTVCVGVVNTMRLCGSHRACLCG